MNYLKLCTRLLLLFSFVVFSCSRKGSSHSASAKTAPAHAAYISTANMNADIINEMNEYRKGRGLPPLHLLALAATEAEKHSRYMASGKTSFGHGGFRERAIAIANDLNGTAATGENVAFGHMTARQVVAAWLKKPDRRANIEGVFDYTGAGVAKDRNGAVYYTVLFVKK
jgi:uncharacterized protein YkwD